MRTKEFLARLDHDRITKAIAAVETKTSGEIRVFVQRGKIALEPLEAARRLFKKLAMEKTSERNAILIFVAPRAQKFAVIGDEGVHQKCSEQFWQQLVDSMRAHFKSENFTEALVEAIEEAGKLLAQYFPRTSPTNRNELPDEVIED